MRITGILLCAVTCSLALAAPMRAAAPEYLSPEQTAPGRVTFRYYAPRAQQVSVHGLRGRADVAMTKGGDDLWSATVDGLAPDIYNYTFDVDGAWVIDPKNRFLKNWITSESAVEVRGATPTDYALLPVPHGVVHHHLVHSAVGQREMPFLVYTPPGYDPKAKTLYPLIVLFHGTGDLADGWIEIGRANLIADNLIAQGKMKAAVILLPYGHPVPLPLERPKTYWISNDPAMSDMVLGELLPFVEKNYAVSKNSDQHAIAGLSMGGGHALNIGLAHPEIFHWIGAFSASIHRDSVQLDRDAEPWLKAVKQKKNGPRLLWISIGRDDQLLEANEKFTTWLQDNGVPFTWKLTDGGHEWPLWRTDFSSFAQLVFQ
jgi:enterochelin esterase-like enzyme